MISANISTAEAFKSAEAIKRGIDNTTNDETIIANMKHVATNVFEPLRKHFNRPIGITSFWRSKLLNKAIKGASNSQHLTGEAMDIDAEVYGGLSNAEIFHWIKENVEFDQLIWEFGNNIAPDWIHVSLKRIGTNRKEILIAKIIKGKRVYEKY